MNLETEKITIGVINYNGINTLPQTLASIQNLDYPNLEVIVVDNLSTDGSREWVLENSPEVDCICLDYNKGSATARNVILNKAQTKYILYLDNDIVLESDVVTRLLQVMKTVPQVAACHPEICDPNDPTVYHYNGSWIHYLCASIARTNDTGERPEYEVFDTVSGAALLVDREAALAVGGFDEDFFFNWEDGDFTCRLTLAGYLCVNVPHAIVHHKSKPRGTSKVFYMTRNRWYFILKLYSWRTLLLSAPMLIIFELSQALFLTMKGALPDYIKGNIAAIQQIPNTLRKRHTFQKIKVKRDRDWLRAGELYVPPNLANSKLLVVLKNIYSDCLNLYWHIISIFC